MNAKNSAEGLLQFFADEFGAILDESLILGAERGCEVAIDIELADNSILYKNGYNDLRLSFQRTSEIA